MRERKIKLTGQNLQHPNIKAKFSQELSKTGA